MSETTNNLTLFIQNLPTSCTKENLDEIFISHGATSTNFTISKHNGKTKGYLNFDDFQKKENCKNLFNGKKILGQVVIIKDFQHTSKPVFQKSHQSNNQLHQNISSFQPLKKINKQSFEGKKIEKVVGNEIVHKPKHNNSSQHKMVHHNHHHQSKKQGVLSSVEQNAIAIQLLNHSMIPQSFQSQQTMVMVNKTEKKRFFYKYHLVFVSDASGSMSGSRWNQVASDLNQTLNDRRNKNAKDLVSIISFNNTATTHCESLPLQKNDFSQVINNIGNSVGGGTDFGSALTEAHRIISIHTQKHPKRIPVLVFLSDGEDDNGDSEMQKLVNEFGKNKLKVFVIAFCNETGKQMLENLSKIGRGKFFNSSQQMDLRKVFTKIEESLVITIQNKTSFKN